MYINKIVYKTLAFVSLFLCSYFPALAATCSVSDVSGSQDCVGEINSPVVDSEGWFNSYGGNGAFNIDQWVFAEKVPIESPDDQITDLGLYITPIIDGEGKSGTWTLGANIFSEYSSVALVFKAGNGFSAYLLDGTTTVGTWDIQGWTSSGLSHASLYVVHAVPIPAAVWLLGSGLSGLLIFRRRSSRVISG